VNFLERHPEIESLVRQMRLAGARIAMMSGSGSTVFGVFDSAPMPSDPDNTNGRSVATHTSSRVVGVEAFE